MIRNGLLLLMLLSIVGCVQVTSEETLDEVAIRVVQKGTARSEIERLIGKGEGISIKNVPNVHIRAGDDFIIGPAILEGKAIFEHRLETVIFYISYDENDLILDFFLQDIGSL
jgi:hypothetical protein